MSYTLQQVSTGFMPHHSFKMFYISDSCLILVTLFLVTLKDNLSHGCVLLTIQPKNISGKHTGDEFKPYCPPSD